MIPATWLQSLQIAYVNLVTQQAKKKSNIDIINSAKITVGPPVLAFPQTVTNTRKELTQVGMDSYVTIQKRGRSPKSTNIATMPKMSKNTEKVSSQNRFAILATEGFEPTEAPKTFKPPPIYLREKNTNDVVKCLVSLIGENGVIYMK